MPLVANTSFNGGEISPLLYHRTELEKRSSSVARLENFLPLPYGGIRKRPGTRHLTQIEGADANTRMIAFRGSDNERYVISLTATHARIFRVSTGTIHSVALSWPITTSNLAALRWVILNDVIFFAHPSCHPFQLSYFGPTNWIMNRTTYTSFPENDQNLNENNAIGIRNFATGDWANGTAYVAGNFVVVRSSGTLTEYRCTTNHTAATATNQPGSGSNWRAFWEIRTYGPGSTVLLEAFPSASIWATGTAYVIGDYVTHNGFYWRALQAHTSAASTTPGAETLTVVGSHWVRCTQMFSPLHVPVGPPSTSAATAQFLPPGQFIVTTTRDAQLSRVSIRPQTANSGTFSPAIPISGAWTFTTFGTWGGIFTLQRSRDNGTTWEDIATYESEVDANYNESFEEEFCVLIRCGYVANSFSGSSSITTNRRGVITPSSRFVSTRYEISELISFVSPVVVVLARAIDTGLSGTTTRWTESAFNRRTGFPSAISIFQRRLIYSATNLRPLDIWMSRIEDFGSFRSGTLDDSPVHVTLAPASQNRILWLAGQRRLHVGCQTGEWVVGSQTNDAPITPTNFQATEVTTYGSSETVQPLLIGDATVFLQRHDQRIREMGFIADRETYDSADLTRLAEHLLTPNLRITHMAWQESREPTLWCIVSDGTLRTLTYIRSEKVFAWARHRTQAGSVVNIAVSQTQADDDEVYWLVNRSGAFMLEVLPPNAQQMNETGPTSGLNTSASLPAVYDSQYTGPPISAALPDQTRWGGLGKYTPAGDAANANVIRAINPGDDPIAGVSNYVAGIPVVASVITLPLEVATESGTSLTRYKNATKLAACVYLGRNLECAEYRPNMEGEIAQPFAAMRPTREASTRYAAYQTTTAPAPALQAGWVEANVNLSSLNLCAEIRHTAPTPCTITAIVWNVSISP